MSPWIPKRPYERQRFFFHLLYFLMLDVGVFVLIFILQDAFYQWMGWPLPE